MKKKSFLMFSIIFLLFFPMTINATEIILGDKDFTEGVSYSSTKFNSDSAGEPEPFDQLYGSDLYYGPDFDKSWTFSYTPFSVTDASIEFGLMDYDFFAVTDSVVSLFSVDGIDLTGLLNAAISSKGIVDNIEYNVFDIDLSSALPQLLDGSATFTLRLQAPQSTGQVYNGAGIDFATLKMNQNAVPEPATMILFGIGLLGIAGVSRKK